MHIKKCLNTRLTEIKNSKWEIEKLVNASKLVLNKENEKVYEIFS